MRIWTEFIWLRILFSGGNLVYVEMKNQMSDHYLLKSNATPSS